MRVPLDFELYRVPHWADPTELGDRFNGYFKLETRGMIVVASSGEGWGHVSVSFRGRCPTWGEMEEIKRRFWEDTDTVMQLHVPPAEHKNYHPFCLHLWRPTQATIPRPPSGFVAP